MSSKAYQEHTAKSQQQLAAAFMRGARNVKDTKPNDAKTTKKG